MEQVAVIGGDNGLAQAIVALCYQRQIKTSVLVEDQTIYADYDNESMVQVITGNPSSHGALAQVLEYSDTIFFTHDLHFKEWNTILIEQIHKIADVAAAVNARIIYPSSAYVFGKKTTNKQAITEETAPQPSSEIGQLGLAIENRLSRSSMLGAKVTIVRTPEVFGPNIGLSPVKSLFMNSVQSQSTVWPGPVTKPHNFIFVNDLANFLFMLGENEETEDRVIHLPAKDPITIEGFLDLISKHLVDNPDVKVAAPTRLSKLVKILFERQNSLLSELDYYYNEEFNLQTIYPNLLKEFHYTDFENAIKMTLQSLS